MRTRFVKDPASVEPFFVVWCSPNNTNDGSSTDSGELQGETISASDWTISPVTLSPLTEDSEDSAAITIQGIAYGINTVATIWLSGGLVDTDYTLVNDIETSGSRTLEHTITIMCRNT